MPNAKIDPATCQAVSTSGNYAFDCLGITCAQDSLWMCGMYGDRPAVWEVDATTGLVRWREDQMPGLLGLETPRGMAYDGTRLWIIDQTGKNRLWIFDLDPYQQHPLRKAEMPDGWYVPGAPQAIAFDGRNLWVACVKVVERAGENKPQALLWRYDPSPPGYNTVSLEIPLCSLTYDNARKRLWGIGMAGAQAVRPSSWQLSAIDAGQTVQTMPAPVPGDSGGHLPSLAWDGRDSLWVGYGDASLTRISLPPQRATS